MIRFFLTIGLFVFCSRLCAQQWVHSFYVPGQNLVQSVIEDRDSGLLLAILDPLEKNINLLKTDINGNRLWERKYLLNGRYLSPSFISMDKSNCYYLSGTVSLHDTLLPSSFLLKLNPCYEVEWLNVYMKPSMVGHRLDQLIHLDSGTMLSRFAHLEKNYTHISKLDSTGTPLWFNTVDAFYGFVYNQDNAFHFIGIGDRPIPSNPGVTISKSIYRMINSSGKLIYEDTYKLNDTNSMTFGISLSFINSVGHIKLMNLTPMYSGFPDAVYVEKYRNNNLVSYKILNDTNFNDVPVMSAKISENRFLVTSHFFHDSLATNTYTGLYLIDSNLNLVRSNQIDLGFYQTSAFFQCRLHDGNILLYHYGIASETSGLQDPLIVKIDTNLNIMPSTTISKSYSQWCTGSMGDSTINITSYNLIDLSNDSFPLGIKKPIQADKPEKTGHILYPNPGNGQLVLWLEKPQLVDVVRVYDISGRLVASVKTGGEITDFNISQLRTGIYFIEAIGRQGQVLFVEKYVKQE